MFFLGEIEHRFGSVDSFSRYYRVIAQSKESAWRILDKLASTGSIGPYPAMYPVKGSYVGDAGHLVIVDAITETDAVVFYSKALERFPLHTDGSAGNAEAPEDFPEYVKEIARRLGRSLVNREAKVEQSVLLHAIAASIGETDWQKLRTKFAGVTEPAAQVVPVSPAWAQKGGTDMEPAFHRMQALLQGDDALQRAGQAEGPPTVVVMTDGEPLSRSHRGHRDDRRVPLPAETRVEVQPTAPFDATDVVIAREKAEAQVRPATLTVVFQDDTLQGDIKRAIAPWLSLRTVRPTFVFSADSMGTLWGRGGTIPEVDLPEALEKVNARHPEIRMAVVEHLSGTGITLAPGSLETFAKAFEDVAREMLSHQSASADPAMTALLAWMGEAN